MKLHSCGQSLTYVLYKPYENEVTLREQNLPLKCWLCNRDYIFFAKAVCPIEFSKTKAFSHLFWLFLRTSNRGIFFLWSCFIRKCVKSDKNLSISDENLSTSQLSRTKDFYHRWGQIFGRCPKCFPFSPHLLIWKLNLYNTKWVNTLVIFSNLDFLRKLFEI